MIKSDLRQLYLSKQKSISKDYRAAASAGIVRNLFSGFDPAPVSCLHCFIPIEKFNEVDTRSIFEKVWRDFSHIHTVVPRVDFETNEIRSLKFGPETELVKNAWDIEEPTHNEFVEIGRVDMVLVPGLCFDLAGHRVGYGKGFYDRLLLTCRPDCLKIGLSYFAPVEKIDDVHDGDVRLDFVVAPEQVYQTGQNRER